NNVIPYLSTYFRELAPFTLDTKYSVPFNSWYACTTQDCLSYPTQTSVSYNTGSATGTISNYDPVCGVVHVAPNARYQYDLQSPYAVSTSCSHYRDGTNQKDVFTTNSFAPYQTMAQDCQGPFMVWWRQNFPGLGNNARDASGAQMLNWWPFLFY